MRMIREEAEKKIRVLILKTLINHVTEFPLDAGAEEPLWNSALICFKGLGDHSGSGLQDGLAGARTRGMSRSYPLMSALTDC